MIGYGYVTRVAVVNIGADIEIACGDECLLLKQTTAEWWYVLKHGDKKPIYVSQVSVLRH